MKRFLFDVDGVSANFTLMYLDCLFEATGIRRSMKDAAGSWDVGDALGLSKTQRAAVRSCMQLPGRAFSMKTYPGSVEAIKAISKFGDVHFVTSPYNSPTWVYDRDQWLQQHFGWELGKKVTYTDNKHICAGDVFVDDKPDNVESWSKAWPGKLAILWDQSYNRDSDVGLRMRGWSLLLEMLT